MSQTASRTHLVDLSVEQAAIESMAAINAQWIAVALRTDPIEPAAISDAIERL